MDLAESSTGPERILVDDLYVRLKQEHEAKIMICISIAIYITFVSVILFVCFLVCLFVGLHVDSFLCWFGWMANCLIGWLVGW